MLNAHAVICLLWVSGTSSLPKGLALPGTSHFAVRAPIRKPGNGTTFPARANENIANGFIKVDNLKTGKITRLFRYKQIKISIFYMKIKASRPFDQGQSDF